MKITAFRIKTFLPALIIAGLLLALLSADAYPMRVKGSWRFKSDFSKNWRFQKQEEVTVPEFARLYDNGAYWRSYQNGTHNQLYRRLNKDAWKQP
jgi:hypothetical protein